MNYGIVIKILGSILIIESMLMTPSLMISLSLREESVYAFLNTIIITLLIGLIFKYIPKSKSTIKAKEGLAIVTIGWIVMSLFGALPFYLSNSTPTYIDALFETVSGFTTTGSSVISNVEALSKGILFWRSFTHWIGGMGILVFTLALLPALGIGGVHIFKAESPGPVAGKIVPRLKDTARILYVSYISITILEILFLKLGGLSIFEAMTHTFSTVGTGGFGVRNDSITSYNSYVHVVISIFMVLSGMNFSLHFTLYKRKFKEFYLDEELRLYIKFIVVSIILIVINLLFTIYDDIWLAIRDSFFQVGSIMTTTGFSTVDFDLWPTFSKMILLVLMFIGGSAGSTAGGMKVIRILIVFKSIKQGLSKIFHPRAYIPIKVGGRTVSNEVIERVNSFLALHIIVFIVATLFISLEGVDLVTSISSVAATLNNIGPGLSLVGPTKTYYEFSQWSKLLFSALMLMGRLELFTVIALIVPNSWTRES
ncbi:MAG: TrkH family potassium uptake protein [Eubacteriaceae bacterium]